MALNPGTKLGPYEVVSALDAGGMGEVYRALDTRLERTVAIKVLSPQVVSSTNLKERFEREARAISALNHPNICQLYDVGSQDGTEYLVMEFLEGETLADRLEGGAMGAAGTLGNGARPTLTLVRCSRRNCCDAAPRFPTRSPKPISRASFIVISSPAISC